MAAYENNLAETAPPERRRQALLKIIDLSLAQNRPAETIQRLEKFLSQYPNDPVADVALLSLGELYLKEHLATPATNHARGSVQAPVTTTNRLPQALAEFEMLIQKFPGSRWRQGTSGPGLVSVDRGTGFRKPHGFQTSRRPVAVFRRSSGRRFKLADCQFLQKDFAGALTNYRAVIETTHRSPRPKAVIRASALPDGARQSRFGRHDRRHECPVNDSDQYPDSYLCDRSMLLVGQQLKDPVAARRFIQTRCSASRTRPCRRKSKLAIARTYERGGKMG